MSVTSQVWYGGSVYAIAHNYFTKRSSQSIEIKQSYTGEQLTSPPSPIFVTLCMLLEFLTCSILWVWVCVGVCV